MIGGKGRTLTVGAVQAAPAFLDAQETTRRIVAWIERAAEAGVRLLAFGETFMPGYPFWLSSTGGAAFDDDRQKAAFAAYLAAAVEANGPELDAVQAACGKFDVAAILGFAERGSGVATGSCYASLAFFHPTRGMAAPHRKLVPTYEERLVWSPGDGHGLRGHELDGVTITALNCWENWMPQARHAMYGCGSEVHVAIWPGSVRLTHDITRFMAREGRLFVVSAGATLCRADIDARLPIVDALDADPTTIYQDGGSCIAGPGGEFVVAPEPGERGLVVTTLQIDAVRAERQNFDPTGHYARPDVFDVNVDRRRRAALHFSD